MSEALWTERFGADPALVGREIVVDGLRRTVIGIVPPDFAFPFDDMSIWMPAAYTPERLAIASSSTTTSSRGSRRA